MTDHIVVLVISVLCISSIMGTTPVARIIVTNSSGTSIARTSHIDASHSYVVHFSYYYSYSCT